jgi:hypothetical protein
LDEPELDEPELEEPEFDEPEPEEPEVGDDELGLVVGPLSRIVIVPTLVSQDLPIGQHAPVIQRSPE